MKIKKLNEQEMKFDLKMTLKEKSFCLFKEKMLK